MSAVAKLPARAVLAMPEDEAIEVIRNSLYPGARIESVKLVLAWCKATGRDPMKKPVHIVPMWVKDATTGKGEMRDVIMPGIGTYRTDAANTGEYVGKSEPEFGPDVSRDVGGVRITYPQWCKVTVFRHVEGKERPFVAKEYWTENYATKSRDSEAPNAMWSKRPYAQLAKCSEAQALRMAFPDETGNTNTAEEMEGKTFDGVTIDAAPERRTAKQSLTTRELDEATQGDIIPQLQEDKHAAAMDRLAGRIEAAQDMQTLEVITGDLKIVAYIAHWRKSRPDLAERYDTVIHAALDRLGGDAAEPVDDAEDEAA